jgi:Cdc6-like AAA superfamily ATPase
MDDGRGLNTLMVTGKPGGGKTLLLSNILKGVAKQQYKYFLSADEAKSWDILKEQKGLNKTINVLEFNAMAYSTCFPLVTDIIAKIEHIAKVEMVSENSKNGLYILEKFKMNIKAVLKSNSFIIMIDEMDTLAKNDAKNFILLNELLNINENGFIKIGVSNTLDLFASYKNTKNYVECKQVYFKPYSEEDLCGILKERIYQVRLRIKDKISVGKTFKIEQLIEANILAVITKKIHKAVFGDIRTMLNIVREIFENKLESFKKDTLRISERAKLGETCDFQEMNFKVTLTEAMGVIDLKYADPQEAIIKSFSLIPQTFILAVFFCLTDERDLVNMVIPCLTQGPVSGEASRVHGAHRYRQPPNRFQRKSENAGDVWVLEAGG